MAAPQPYAGFDDATETLADPRPSDADRALARAEAENRQLRATIKSLEQSLSVAGKVLAPYLRRQ